MRKPLRKDLFPAFEKLDGVVIHGAFFPCVAFDGENYVISIWGNLVRVTPLLYHALKMSGGADA